MTTYHDVVIKCAACGHAQEVSRLMSTGLGGSPDLDLRPNGYGRSPMASEAERCAACGYCAIHLDLPLPAHCRQTMQSADYVALSQRRDLPRAALYTACCGLIEERAGNLEQAGLSALRAAWICDDSRLHEAARELRIVAAQRLERDWAGRQLAPALAALGAAQIADVWRRAGQFDRATDAARRALDASGSQSIGRPLLDMLRFQLQLAEARDDRAHTVSEAEQAAPDWPQLKAERDAKRQQEEAARETARLGKLANESPRAFIAAFALLSTEFEQDVARRERRVAAVDVSTVKAWLVRLPMPESMRAIMQANVRAYAWPPLPALAAYALATLQCLGEAEQLRCADAAKTWKAVLGEHELLYEYLSWCLREALPVEWHYSPAQRQGEGPRPPHYA